MGCGLGVAHVQYALFGTMVFACQRLCMNAAGSLEAIAVPDVRPGVSPLGGRTSGRPAATGGSLPLYAWLRR
jgi:hypothetical protein